MRPRCGRLEGVLVEEESGPLLPLQGAQQYESVATGKILERKWHPFGKDRTPAGLATWLAVAPRVPWLATKVLHLAPGFHETTSEVAPFFPNAFSDGNVWGSKVEVLSVCNCANKGEIARKECSKSESTVRPRFGCVSRTGEAVGCGLVLFLSQVESATQ